MAENNVGRRVYLWVLLNFFLPLFPVLFGGLILLLQGRLEAEYIRLLGGTDLLLLSFTILMVTWHDWNRSTYDRQTTLFAVVNIFLLAATFATWSGFTVVYIHRNIQNLQLLENNIIDLNWIALSTSPICAIIQFSIAWQETRTRSTRTS
ncbi:MAG: hypothetical protein SF029_11710 [bacterium]|nr:hypothetical protein [bacterium]